MSEKRKYIHYPKPADYEIELPPDLSRRITEQAGIVDPHLLPAMVVQILAFDQETLDLAIELKAFLTGEKPSENRER
jgi:hypothetical protein